MKTRIVCVLLSFAAVVHGFADPMTKSIQQKLKDGGFYYGEVDGNPGSETEAALKRFQIRQGLTVTGKADLATVEALGAGGNTAYTQQRQGAAPTVNDSYSRDRGAGGGNTYAPDSPIPGLQPYGQPSQPRLGEPTQPRPQVQPQPQARTWAVSPDTLARLFVNTPYESAPTEMQQEILRRAQFTLKQTGDYSGEIDGAPGRMTAAAIAQYQRQRRLPYTGTLDMATLAEMRLLPQVVPPPPGWQGGYEPYGVSFGVWGR